MAAHRVHGTFILYTLYTFPKFSFLSSQHLKPSQIRGNTIQVLTLERKALPDLTQANPSLAGHCMPHNPLLRWPPPGLHFCTWAFSIPLPEISSETHKAQALPSFQSPPIRHIHSQPPDPHSPPPALHRTVAHSTKHHQPITDPVAFSSAWQEVIFNKYLLNNEMDDYVEHHIKIEMLFGKGNNT